MQQTVTDAASATGLYQRPIARLCANIAGETATVAYISVIAFIAQATGFIYVLFPELGALSHDILKRPHGVWAKAPFMLILTPFLSAIVGTFVTQHLAYGLIPVLLTIACAIVLIRMLRSPIAPAISAGLLPLTLGLTSGSVSSRARASAAVRAAERHVYAASRMASAMAVWRMW